ncbi:HD domain-containing protein [Halorubrum vacuolatum]|uniref:GTP pyrophosphokinase n=1 Tax=Halorubrum vacuolatum TaxID=63740 RepID=A0A238XG36_HALVU|nr:HD domain-containing protein [Halorubrum vacuolatum]SNR56889.1 GTP pyrophosphokinase [Halorubrum vacuolatum]
MNDLERAIDIALTAHTGDTDKAGATYIRHPLRLMEQMDSETERIVAVLHDVVEDSEYELEDIEDEFGPDVRDAVDALTKREGEAYIEEFISRCAQNEIARRVKEADIKDNMDLTRLSDVTQETAERQIRYHRALQRLESAKE